MIMMKKLYIPLVVLVLTAAGVSAQYTDADKMKQHADKGYELFESGYFRPALIEFAKAKEFLTPDTRNEAVKLDYHIAESAARVGERDAMEKLRAFLYNYPESIYSNDVKFAVANLYYLQEEYMRAEREYAAISVFDLRTSQQDEYHFKNGHVLFLNDRYNEAQASLRMVDRYGEYGPHARYYTAYIDYVNGNYSLAKTEFQQLQDNPSYGKVIPFYILQIEFLEGNYDYVIREGAPLLEAAKGEREAEIARIIGESWFHKGDYERTVTYMDRYRKAGGEMGRAENYLVGYSLYMRNDISDAIYYLSQVVGPDDKLTQNAAYHLGECYLMAGDKFKAMQSFSMASGADYEPAIKEDALFNYGKLQYELGGGVFNEAINVLTRYISEYPSSPRVPEARELLVAAYYNSNNYDAAYEAIQLIPNPDNNVRTAYQKIAYFRALEYYNQGDYNTAWKMLDESYANRFNQKYTALTQFWRGEILYNQGNYDRAVPFYREYISTAPATEREYKMAEYNLGYSYFNQQKYGDAKSWFERFVRNYTPADSYKADAFNRLGDTYYATREFSKAQSNYDASMAVGTRERYYAEFQKAMVLGFTANQNRKIDALRGIINKGEGDYVGEAMYELGRTYIGMERFSDGASTLKRFTEEYPSSDKYLSALSELGLAYQNMNDNQSALKYYKMVVDKAPASPQARDAMVAVKSIYVDMNDVDGYFAFAGKSGVQTETGAVERDSLSFVAAERVYMTSGDMNRAVGSLNDYLGKFPNGVYKPNALYYVSDAYTSLGQTDNAIRTLTELSNLYYNSFTVRGLEKLAPMAYNANRYRDAAAAYKNLAEVSVNPQTAGTAWSGYLKSAKADGDFEYIYKAAEDVLAAKGVPASAQREAKSVKADILTKRGDEAGALAIYKELAVEVQSAEGAEATYRVIEATFESGDLDAAEKAVLKFAGQNTPHTYWLGKAFLVLGDVYILKGDAFQARATLQSIVDGYLPANDGVVAEAKEKIAELGNN